MHGFYLLILPLPLGKSLIFHVSLVIFSISPCPKLLWPYCLVPPHHRSCQRPGCFPSPGWIPTPNRLEWGGLPTFCNVCLTEKMRKSTQPTSHVQSSRCQTASFESANAFTFNGASLRPNKDCQHHWLTNAEPISSPWRLACPLVGIPADRCRGCWT